MNRAVTSLIGFLLSVGVARAQTYELAFTGDKLTRTPGYKPIHHIKHLNVVVSSSTPFPADSCFDVPLSEVTTLTDGVDSLQSLAAAGYIEDPGATRIHLCSNEPGTEIKRWQVFIDFISPMHHGGEQTYSIAFCNQICEMTPYYQSASFYFRVHDIEAEENTTESGKWKVSVVDR